MLTVAVVGPESTGKTTLAKSLAAHFKTEWVPEFAREYLTDLNRPYTQTDLLEIAKGQLRAEKKLQPKAKNNLLFLDTDLLVIKIWSEFKYGNCDPWIEQQLRLNQPSIYILTHFDIPYEDDPLRENRGERPELFDLYEEALQNSDSPYFIVQGNQQKRLDKAVKSINSIL